MAIRPKRDRKLSVALSDDDWHRLEKLLEWNESRTVVATTLSALAYAVLLAGLRVLETHTERPQRHTSGT